MSYNNSSFEFDGGPNSQETEERDGIDVSKHNVINDDPERNNDETVMLTPNAIPKIQFHAHQVHFFARNPTVSEETALIQGDQNDSQISYFVKPSELYSKFSKFKFMHASIALSDLLHKIVYTSLVASFVLFARSYLECDATNSLMILYAVISCCLLTSATFMICMDVCFRKLSIIITCSLVYLIGISIISWLSGNFKESSACRWWSIFALYLVCFGEAGTRTALPEFSMIHFASGELDRHNVYIWRFHWLSNMFLILAIAIITAVQQKYTFEVGYYICIAICLAEFTLFMLSFRNYKKSQLSHSSSLRFIWNIMKEAREIKEGSRKAKRR